jgi:hypothetical protein
MNMKAILLGSLFLSLPAFAQNIDLETLKQFITSKKETFEKVHVAMSKKLTTTGSITVSAGICEFTQISEESILKIIDKKMIVMAKQSFTPTDSPACQSVQYKAYQQTLLYYENKPSVDADLVDLDASASVIKSITKVGDIVSIAMNLTSTDPTSGATTADNVTMKYDYSKPSFDSLILSQGRAFSTSSIEITDIEISKVDLHNVLFCNSSNDDASNCQPGDYSDILF